MLFKDTLQTFSSKNVRRLYIGDFGIFLGFWLSFLNIIWLVFQLTQSSLSLGLMGLVLNLSIALLIISVGLISFSFSTDQTLSLILIFFINGAWMMLLATTSVTLQLIVDDNKRGRVMGFFAMGVFGLMPFTNLLVGAIFAWLGVTWGIFTVGAFCALVALFYWSGTAFYCDKLLAFYKERGMSESERAI